jgi:putative addiction module killer protein
MYTIYTTESFDQWFLSLKDKQTKTRIQARIDRVEDGNFGDHKSIGDGVFELRFFFGSGYRVYYCQRGELIVILLAGGDKSSQASDIKTAIELTKTL